MENLGIDLQQVAKDLGPFTDLGSAPPILSSGREVIYRHRGEKVMLKLEGEACVESRDGIDRNYATFGAMLSSQYYGNLSAWAGAQRILLGDRTEVKDFLAVQGVNQDGFELDALKMLETFLFKRSEETRNSICLIDGPAGIGKTSIIRKLTFQQASAYQAPADKLILHVESKGRSLQNLNDLIAFSLQTLRVDVTYDQVPILVKHGLITLAIDGFDELGDPNGYDLAWGSMNELLEAIRGRGSLILSGRETFIGQRRVEDALKAYDPAYDSLQVTTLRTVAPPVARAWLKRHHWTDEELSSFSARALLEEGSYALRPFFLSILADEEIGRHVKSDEIEDTLSFLMEKMVERELGKFGDDVDRVSTPSERRAFIDAVMEEIARELADSQTEIISEEILYWISDSCSSDFPENIRGILRNRVAVLAFLTNADRRGFRRFVHESIHYYFLSRNILKTVSSSEFSKYLRRATFDLTLLDAFQEALRFVSPEIRRNFGTAAIEAIQTLPSSDSARANLAALVIAMAGASTLDNAPTISDVYLEESLFSETVSTLILERCSFNQVYCRGGDLRAVSFLNCHIVTLNADKGTFPSKSIPRPVVLNLPDSVLNSPEEIEIWFGTQFYLAPDAPTFDFNFAGVFDESPIFQLLDRVVRYRPFWIKDSEDASVQRILEDERWPGLLEALRRHDFVLERTDVQSSGRASAFIHVRRKELLQNYRSFPDTLLPLIRDLMRMGSASSR